MKTLKNKEIKKILIFSIIIILISGIIIGVVTTYKFDKYKENTNNTILQIIKNIKEKYPEVKEAKIIEILNNKESIKSQEDLLNKYGIFENESYIYSNIKIETQMIFINITILILTSILLLIIFYIYLKNKQKKVEEITKYIEKISNKEYILEIKDNTEDELNILKNELYKIMVMLKEDAEISKKQKESLKNSVSDISHQLKTPLTSILILLDNLNDNENMDNITKKKFIKEITNQIENMNWLVVSLLKLSRLDSGIVKFENKKINLNKLVLEVVSNLEIMSELKNVKVKIEQNEEINIIGDYNWNKEAVQNIIKNAIEHTKNNKEVCIKIMQNKVYTEIQIEDQGEGICDKDIKHIFKRFYKTENSSENNIGIGLALSKAIIEKQNGYISVYSKKDKGTIFEIKYIK